MFVRDRLAFEIFSATWSRKAITKAAHGAFKRKQNWLDDLIGRLLERWQTKPAFAELQRFIGCDREFRQACKTNNLNFASLRRRPPGARSIASCRWDLPPLESVADLSGWLGITTRRLGWLAAAHLADLTRPEHYVCTWITKRSAGLRLIESPKSQLKSIQRQILDDLLCHIGTHDACHGFKRGRSVLSFAKPHIGRPMCLKMDLKDFFPRIQVNRVTGLFRSVGYSRPVAYLLACLVTTRTPQHVLDNAVPGRPAMGASELSRRYLPRHLPQGTPTSPMLANLIAYRLDCRLFGLASRLGASYTRYADDLLFSGGAEFARAAKRFQITVGAIALEEGHDVNFRKTRFMRQSQRQLATGIVLNDRPNVKREAFETLKAILHNCVRLGPDSQNLQRVDDFRAPPSRAYRMAWASESSKSESVESQV